MSFAHSVIQGEAIESDNDDSDVEYQFHSTCGQGGKHIVEFQGTVYSGEAPESDDEIPSISNVKIGKEVTEVFQSPSAPPVRPQFFETQSVLQKLLVERNQLFWHHLNQTVQNTVVTASSKILAAEELLVQSQLTIQAASRSIKQANDTADQVLVKCQDILTSEFLPDITIPT